MAEYFVVKEGRSRSGAPNRIVFTVPNGDAERAVAELAVRYPGTRLLLVKVEKAYTAETIAKEEKING